MSDHLFMWVVVLVGPVGQRLVVAAGASRFKVERKRARLGPPPVGWTYRLERRAA